MNPSKYSVTFACYNQVNYTRQCVDSMIKHGLDLSRLVVVDNGSSDDTREYLSTLPLGGRIFNKSNLGCGVAWNQGALALQSEWTIIMNNDVLVSRGWLENLIDVAEGNGLKIISPALIEGPLDYDLDAFAEKAMVIMKDALRIGGRHAVCLAVHESVWPEIGYFQPIPQLLGYEDTMFFHEVDKAKIPIGMTGRSWLHHYGSITVSGIRQERGLSKRDGLGYRRNYRLLRQSWLERKLKKLRKLRQKRVWCAQEISQFGMSMYGARENGRFSWK